METTGGIEPADKEKTVISTNLLYVCLVLVLKAICKSLYYLTLRE